MALQRYVCDDCSHNDTYLVFGDQDPEKCDNCGGVKLERQFPLPAPAQLKGVGWERDGYMSSNKVTTETTEADNGSTVTVRKHEGTPPNG